jgi:hypothetical protein
MDSKDIKALRNSAILAGIVFFSSMLATGYPSFTALYTSALTFGSVFCIEMANNYKINISGKKGTSVFL